MDSITIPLGEGVVTSIELNIWKIENTDGSCIFDFQLRDNVVACIPGKQYVTKAKYPYFKNRLRDISLLVGKYQHIVDFFLIGHYYQHIVDN